MAFIFIILLIACIFNLISAILMIISPEVYKTLFSNTPLKDPHDKLKDASDSSLRIAGVSFIIMFLVLSIFLLRLMGII